MENTLENIKNKIDNIEILLEEKITNNSIEDLKKFKEKINDVFDFYLTKMNKINFNLLQESTFVNIFSNLNNLDISLKNFFTSNSNNYFSNAKSYFDNIIALVNNIPDINKETAKETLNQIIGRFKSNFEKINNDLSNKEKNFENTIELFNKEILSLKEENIKLSQKIEKQNNDIISYLNSFNNTFLENQNTRNDDFIKTKNTINTEYKEILKEQDEAFMIMIKESISQFENQKNKIEANFNKINEDLQTQSNIIIESIEKDKDKSGELLGVVGKNVYAGNYMKYANHSKLIADKMFWLSLKILSVVAILVSVPIIIQLLTMFLDNSNSSVDFWKSLAYRIPALFVLLLPAFYLSIEARKQREKEFKYRDFEIKISAITPYMNDIKDVNNDNMCEKDKVKLELAKVFFGDTYKENSNDNIIIPKDVINLIDSLTDKIIKITGKGKQ